MTLLLLVVCVMVSATHAEVVHGGKELIRFTPIQDASKSFC